MADFPYLFYAFLFLFFFSDCLNGWVYFLKLSLYSLFALLIIMTTFNQEYNILQKVETALSCFCSCCVLLLEENLEIFATHVATLISVVHVGPKVFQTNSRSTYSSPVGGTIQSKVSFTLTTTREGEREESCGNSLHTTGRESLIGTYSLSFGKHNFSRILRQVTLESGADVERCAQCSTVIRGGAMRYASRCQRTRTGA